jgi:hypothetical protein
MDRRQRRRRSGRPSIATLRVAELNRLFNDRYRGGLLPDDDDGRDSLEIMIDHLAMVADPYSRIEQWARRWAPWLDRAELERLAAKAVARPIRWTADKLAARLNLHIEERDRLKINTIGAVDLNAEQRKVRRRKRDRIAKQAKRRDGGATPQDQSAARTKPWKEAGVSRSKWYADRRATAKPSRLD